MSEKKPAAQPGPKVSPARTLVSLLLLLIVGAICVIELRAGLGQMLTRNAFAKVSEEGAFNGKVTLEEARGMVKLFPAETMHSDSENEQELKFQWYSLLRPLMNEGSPEIYVVASKGDPPMARSFHTGGEEDSQFKEAVAEGVTGGMPGGGAGGGMAPGGMAPGGMNAGAAAEYGPGGARPPGQGGGEGGGRRGQRPPVEGEDEPKTETPAADESKPADASSATETPATETPAGDAPAGEPAAPPASGQP